MSLSSFQETPISLSWISCEVGVAPREPIFHLLQVLLRSLEKWTEIASFSLEKQLNNTEGYHNSSPASELASRENTTVTKSWKQQKEDCALRNKSYMLLFHF